MPWGSHRPGGIPAIAIGVGFVLLAALLTAAFVVPLRVAVAIVLIVVGGTLIALWRGAPTGRVADRRDESVVSNDTGRLKEEFLATVSHELRTPLNAILGWTELLRTPAALSPRDLDRGLEVIERNARRQLALVEELLAVADPERSAADWQRIDLRALMHALLENLEEPARAADVALQEDPPGDASPASGESAVWVVGDPAGLRLALRHILENALKFTPAGGRVRTRLARRDGDALIAVSDTGPGIDPAIGERVFEPFRQQDSSPSRAHGGLGLGLTIARRLIEAHGGRVDVRSDGPGRGATFLVTLPSASGGRLRQSP
jgi:signal transduction histidine kinase